MTDHYDDVEGWPAVATRVIVTPASRPWSGRCYSCKSLVYDDEERCPYCRHFPESVARRSLAERAA